MTFLVTNSKMLRLIRIQFLLLVCWCVFGRADVSLNGLKNLCSDEVIHLSSLEE